MGRAPYGGTGLRGMRQRLGGYAAAWLHDKVLRLETLGSAVMTCRVGRVAPGQSRGWCSPSSRAVWVLSEDVHITS